jgi:hypothetical protein
VGFSLLLIVLGLGIGTAQQVKLTSLPLRTNGTVVGIFTRDTGDGTERVPVIEFLTASEVKVSFVGRFSLPEHRVGERVVVAYDEERLGQAVIDSPTDTWSMPVITAGMGTVLLLILLVARRLQSKATDGTGVGRLSR